MASSAGGRRLRWAAPFAVAAVIALVVAIPGLSAASTPTLPAITPAQLLAKVRQADVTHLSGTIDIGTDLGIPNLSLLSQAATSGGGAQAEQAFDPTSLLSGSHQALVWFDGPERNRADLLESMAEFDVIHNGADTWTWDSVTKQATHYRRSEAKSAGTPAAPAAAPAKPAAAPEVETPQQLADKMLAKLDPTTVVSVGAPLTVAHRSAYQLVLAPRAAQSTVDHVAIAVDQATGLPLQVAIFAKGQKAAALRLGFGQISFSTPNAGEFDFTPPAGATVTTGIGAGTAIHPTMVPGTERRRGQHLHPALRFMKPAAGAAPAAPAGAAPATKAAANAAAPAAKAAAAGAVPAATSTTATAGHSQVVGSGWTAVTVYDQVQIPPQYQQYLAAGTPVSGRFGSGKLLQTALVNVLVLDNGKVAVGAVDGSALEAAVAAAP